MTTVVAGTTGRDLGTRPARRLRTEGFIPGVVYGLGLDPVPVSVGYADLREALKGDHGFNTVFTLDVDGEQIRVIVKEMQRDPIRRTVAHVDLLRVEDSVPVKITLPIRITGRPSKVLDAGGIVEQKMFQMRVAVTPNRIPAEIEVDVSDLTLDGRIAVSDVSMPDGVAALVGSSITVAAPVITRAARMAAQENGEDDEETEA